MDWISKTYSFINDVTYDIFKEAIYANDLAACHSVLVAAENAGQCSSTSTRIQQIFEMAFARVQCADPLYASVAKTRYLLLPEAQNSDMVEALFDSTTLDLDAASTFCIRLLECAARCNLKISGDCLPGILAPARMKQNAERTLLTLSALQRVALSDEQRRHAIDLCSPCVVTSQDGEEEMTSDLKITAYLTTAGLAEGGLPERLTLAIPTPRD